MKKKVMFLCNYPYGYVLSARSRHFSEELNDKSIISRVLYKKNSRLKTFLYFFLTIIKSKPSLIYTMEGFYNETLALFIKLFFRIPYIVDRADTFEDFLKNNNSPFFITFFISKFERIILSKASAVVCRGINQSLIFRSRYYNKKIIHLSEGTDIDRWKPKSGNALRKRLKIPQKALVISTMGTAIWGVSNHFFGREIIEVLKNTKDKNIYGIILPSLTSNEEALNNLIVLADKYDIRSKLYIIRDVSRSSVPDYLGAVDIAISTQVNNISGEMRTTAKLPDYLACGKFVLTSNIGDALRYLPPEMLVVHDEHYYKNLQNKIEIIYKKRNILKLSRSGIKIAQDYFDYKKISKQAKLKISEILFS
jgi:hypothetical protein